MKAITQIWQWFKDKLGRITTAAGIALQGIETIDISVIKDPLESFLGHKGVQGIIVGLFVVSYLRHQYVAKTVSMPPLPPPDPSTIAKVILILCAIAIGVMVPRAYATEVPIEKDAPKVEGHPLTSIVVTQCNLIVAVYMTMPDGRLLRFDRGANVPSGELMQMAYSAARSERIEVSCNETGEVGHETHDPI